MRKKPYTEKGISRVPCKKCGAPSAFQWQICATGNLWMGICIEHDIELNKLVLEFMGLPERLGYVYAAQKRALYNPKNSKKEKIKRGECLTTRPRTSKGN